MSLDVDRTRGVKCAGLSGRASLRLPDHWGECARDVAEETEFTNEGTKGNEDDTEKTAGTQGRDALRVASTAHPLLRSFSVDPVPPFVNPVSSVNPVSGSRQRRRDQRDQDLVVTHQRDARAAGPGNRT